MSGVAEIGISAMTLLRSLIVGVLAVAAARLVGTLLADRRRSSPAGGVDSVAGAVFHSRSPDRLRLRQFFAFAHSSSGTERHFLFGAALVEIHADRRRHSSLHAVAHFGGSHSLPPNGAHAPAQVPKFRRTGRFSSAPVAPAGRSRHLRSCSCSRSPSSRWHRSWW